MEESKESRRPATRPSSEVSRKRGRESSPVASPVAELSSSLVSEQPIVVPRPRRGPVYAFDSRKAARQWSPTYDDDESETSDDERRAR
mmetsp:Transcript_9128/g.28993  ORF Transcript_9128/g.28993 Transcript_9128/m.28993 type:complete len:88 (+) Transcript_9128:94-357(+)|eukprot:CAMPEP_0197397182 /NCGR_PEP_ID=MMETSP1165-20131217/11038_1 /TAXON_ID=284809 /ORGANISM="Chrysocystis fragilis, Strain CCMP3189" /LENGTH=87 /DNA_ID=CAMNT_0042923063 /DNA_START=45 /DNA_END=308 /DNA_ORIENTATION=-